MIKVAVAIYIRVSTKEQVDNGFSIEGQINEIRNYCDGKEYKVLRIYKDMAHSGASIERPMLQLMLKHATEKKFNKIIIWKYDRLSRNNVDFPALIYYFNKNDIQIESITEPTLSDGSPYNDFIINILGLVSSLERKVFILRSKMGKRVRVSKGLWMGGKVPYGYRYNKETGYLEINEHEKEVINIIFKKYIETRNYKEIMRYLNKNNIKPHTALKWSDNTVRIILQHRMFIGEYIFGDIKVPMERYRIIDDKTFNLVQKMIGTGQPPAYGYKWDIETGDLVKNEDEIHHVFRFFQLFYDWCSLTQIKDYIKENNVFTKNFGRYWQEQTIIGILCNPIYCGYRQLPGPGKRIMFDEKLKIIEDWIYQDVQTIGKLKYKTFKRYTQDLDEIKMYIINNLKN